MYNRTNSLLLESSPFCFELHTDYYNCEEYYSLELTGKNKNMRLCEPDPFNAELCRSQDSVTCDFNAPAPPPV